ncbi:MAG: nickel-dependent hydrogenase large subunit, partial [Oscillospiraceae bacterium]|nr:nickel-dependent hydrogenase large subunit [Oscillospiraceae bacterium]
MSYIIPIGPYHPALEEPVHARLYTEGEVIKDAEVFVGYNHRGIEKLATERNAIQTLVLVERVCGICSHSHAFTYALSVEDLNGL